MTVRGMSGSVYRIVWMEWVRVDACVHVRVKIEHAVYLPELHVVIEGFVVAAERYFYCSST